MEPFLWPLAVCAAFELRWLRDRRRQPRFRRVRWVRWFGHTGVTLPPFGVYIHRDGPWTGRLIRHELAHWQQYQTLGWTRTVIGYALLWLWHGGSRNHPREVEARRMSVGCYYPGRPDDPQDPPAS